MDRSAWNVSRRLNVSHKKHRTLCICCHGDGDECCCCCGVFVCQLSGCVCYFACGSGCKVLWWVRLCVSVYLSVCLRGYLQSHVQSLSNFLCMLPMAVARSSPGVVAIRFPGFVDDIMFFIYSGLYSGMNLAMKDHVRLNLLTYCSIGQNLIEYY